MFEGAIYIYVIYIQAFSLTCAYYLRYYIASGTPSQSTSQPLRHPHLPSHSGSRRRPKRRPKQRHRLRPRNKQPLPRPSRSRSLRLKSATWTSRVVVIDRLLHIMSPGESQIPIDPLSHCCFGRHRLSQTGSRPTSLRSQLKVFFVESRPTNNSVLDRFCHVLSIDRRGFCPIQNPTFCWRPLLYY